MFRHSLFLALVAACCGCARVSAPLADPGFGGGAHSDLGGVIAPVEDVDLARAAPADMAAPETAPTPPDMAMPPPPPPPADMATPPPPPPDMAMPPAAACHLVVNELQTGTTATGTAEFVEILNPCASMALPLDGVKLVYRASTNTNAKDGKDSSTLYTFASGTLAAGAMHVLAGSGFTGAHDGTLASGMSDTAGAVALRDGAGAVIDSVAWGSGAASSAFCEGTVAPAPPTAAAPGYSIARHPNGADTDNNAHDFQVTSNPTPGAANP
jgi:Lamin Tail Domain